jgi:hypothetical protein
MLRSGGLQFEVSPGQKKKKKIVRPNLKGKKAGHGGMHLSSQQGRKSKIGSMGPSWPGKKTRPYLQNN